MMSSIHRKATSELSPAELQRLLGFLAMKAADYARFPSIRKMSEDWQLIAAIAADNYNAIDALRSENDGLKEDIAFIKQAAMGD